MRIKDVEKLLNIDRETIRFYIKKELIDPHQSSNGYREYTDRDIRDLKKILIMRDLDMSIEDIRGVLQGEKDLAQLLQSSRRNLSKRIELAENAGRMCSELMSSDSLSFDPDTYFRKREEVIYS